MRPIVKKNEPNSLKQYRKKPGATYDGPDFTVVKDDIRKQLLHEQGYLCAYCMQRIYNNPLTTKIDHWHCQDKYGKEQLSYANLLAVCCGNQGSPRASQHCDTHKGNDDVKYNPSDPSHYNKMGMVYGSDGKILSGDATFNNDVDKILNLNFRRLQKNREAVIDSVRQVLCSNSGHRTEAEINKLIAAWGKADGGGALNEYCDVAVFYLKKRLAKK